MIWSSFSALRKLKRLLTDPNYRQSQSHKLREMGLTTDPDHPDLGHGPDDEPGPQNEVYLVLSEQERAFGFVRPVRQWYQHLECGTQTWMNLEIAETYARKPDFYGATYCVGCHKHRPVGANGEFVWVEEGRVTDIKVGT